MARWLRIKLAVWKYLPGSVKGFKDRNRQLERIKIPAAQPAPKSSDVIHPQMQSIQ